MKEKAIQLTKKILSHELISGSSYLFIGTMAGNILAFIFNLILVRLLSYSQYADITAITSLITLAGIPTLAFTPTIVQFASRYFAKDQVAEATLLFRQANVSIGLFALSTLAIFIICSPPLANFLHIENAYEVLMAGFVVVTMYISTTNNAYLQSLLRFRFLSSMLTLGGLLKLGIGTGLLLAGVGIFGILWGYFLSFFIPFLLVSYALRSFFAQKIKSQFHAKGKEILLYGLPATIAVFSLSSFTSSDILLVKHFFSSNNAALYSGLSLIGRIIFYFSAPIATVMFPLATKRFHKGENVTNLLFASFILVLVPSLGLTAIYTLFPKFVISVILGSHYLAIAPNLGWFGLYLSIFSLLNVSVNFLLSIKKTSVSWFIAIGASLQIIGIFIFHANITIVVGISLVLSLVLFMVLLLYYQGSYAVSKKAKK